MKYPRHRKAMRYCLLEIISACTGVSFSFFIDFTQGHFETGQQMVVQTFLEHGQICRNMRSDHLHRKKVGTGTGGLKQFYAEKTLFLFDYLKQYDPSV